ncbi:hypothetical protein ECG_03626 [Echinococcus granulosus]|nr:hypothetical protein ECG_03626 [Echinococcus granulosus]
MRVRGCMFSDESSVQSSSFGGCSQYRKFGWKRMQKRGVKKVVKEDGHTEARLPKTNIKNSPAREPTDVCLGTHASSVGLLRNLRRHGKSLEVHSITEGCRGEAGTEVSSGVKGQCIKYLKGFRALQGKKVKAPGPNARSYRSHSLSHLFASSLTARQAGKQRRTERGN